MNRKDTVLIVDDDLTLLEIAGEILKDAYTVSFAMSGHEALKLIEAGFLPDIILLDVDMPKQNGYEVLSKLRQIKNARNIPVIFLTGLTSEEDEIHGLTLGALDYIKKPFAREILLARLAVHLETGKRIRKRNSLDEEQLKRLVKPLTEAEMKVARLLAKSYTNEEIALELYFSLAYVKKLVSRILGKLGIKRRNEIRKFLH